MEWISVKDEEPPEYQGEVLAWSEKEGQDAVLLAFWSLSGGGWLETWTLKQIKVTHWMPLPKSPKEVNHV